MILLVADVRKQGMAGGRKKNITHMFRMPPSSSPSNSQLSWVTTWDGVDQ